MSTFTIDGICFYHLLRVNNMKKSENSLFTYRKIIICNSVINKIFILILCLIHFGSYGQDGFKGTASYYANEFEGRKTASGEIYMHSNLTCAHRTLPFGTKLKVTNTENNRSVIVTVNDRGPFSPSRVIDLSKSAAEALGFIRNGTTEIIAEIVNDKVPSTIVKDTTATLKQKTTTASLPPDPFSKSPITEKKDSLQILKSGSTFYEIIKVNPTPLGLGIKLATYSDSKGLIEKANDLRQKYNQPVFIQSVETESGSKAYRLFIGRFNDRFKAEDLKNLLRTEFPDCYVITYANFQ